MIHNGFQSWVRSKEMPIIKLGPRSVLECKKHLFLPTKFYQYIYLLELASFLFKTSFGSNNASPKKLSQGEHYYFCIIFGFLPEQLCSGLHALGKCGVGTTVQCCTAKSKAVEGLGTI